MELKELRYFKSIAELSSFSRAALQLRIAQPALSRQVHKLEADLGVELFLRHGRGVTLTPAGSLLLQKVDGIMRQIRQTREEVASCAAVATGHLGLGVPPAAGRLLVPPLLAAYRAVCPGVTVHVVEGFSGHLHEWLGNGRIDMAVLHNPNAARDLSITPVLVEDMYVISGASHVAPVAYTLAELAALPLVLPGFPHSLRQLVATALAQQGLGLKPAIEVDGLSVIKAMVQYGAEHTVLTYGAIAEEAARGELQATPILAPGINWNLCVAMRHELRHSPAAFRLRGMIRGEIVRLVGDGLWRGTLHPDED